MAARRRLSAEERDLWQRVAKSVAPLHPRLLAPAAAPLANPLLANPPQPQPPLEARKTTGPALVIGQQRPPVPPIVAPAKILASGLDKRTVQRLRKGKMPIEGRLDLHGMTQNEAHGALHRFIGASRVMNRRLVLIITGKGWDPMASRREDAVGVLRRSVPRWLETPPLNQHVSAIADAHAKDGGSGALYVLLRRLRRTAPLT
jgi:DNA-nicking Smr family endonuclease